MIRYLDKDEYGKCIPLWKEAFPEDSEEFLDYYFGKKISDSQVIVKEDEGGKLLTMAHLNPYKVKGRGAGCMSCPYIVGVANRCGQPPPGPYEGCPGGHASGHA